MSPEGTSSRRCWLAGLLAGVAAAVVVASLVVLPQLGAVSGLVGLIVVLHVLGYLTLGILALTLAPRQLARVKARLQRWRILRGRART